MTWLAVVLTADTRLAVTLLLVTLFKTPPAPVPKRQQSYLDMSKDGHALARKRQRRHCLLSCYTTGTTHVGMLRQDSG